MSKIRLSLLGDKDAGRWKEFLVKSSNYNFYQELGFIDYYAYKVKETRKFVFSKGNEIIAVLAAGLSEYKGRLELKSPFSASFGGFCYGEGLKFCDAMEIVDIFTDYLMKERISRAIICQPPLIYGKAVDEYIEFSLVYHNYKLSRQDLTLYMDSGDVSAKVMQNVRKAERLGLIFSEEKNIEEAYNFISAQKKKRGIAPSITLADLIELKRLFPENIKTFSITFGNKIIASIIVYLLNGRCALGFSWDHEEGYQQYRPTDLMIYKAAEWVFKNDYDIFDLGTVTLNGEPSLNLARFKDNFNTHGAIRRKYLMEFGNQTKG